MCLLGKTPSAPSASHAVMGLNGFRGRENLHPTFREKKKWTTLRRSCKPVKFLRYCMTRKNLVASLVPDMWLVGFTPNRWDPHKADHVDARTAVSDSELTWKCTVRATLTLSSQ